MSNPIANTNEIHALEHAFIGGVDGKKVFLVDDAGNQITFKGEVDTNNSTATPLAANTGGADHIFTGASTEILNDGIIYVNVFSNVASATDGLAIEQSSDNVNWDHCDNYTVPAGSGKNYAINPHSRYFRIVYTNGVIAQTSFRLQVVTKRDGLASSHRIQDPIVDDDDARLVKAVLTAKANGDGFVNITATSSDNLRVTDAESGLAIAKGDVVDTTFIHKFGEASNINTTDGFVDIWDGLGIVTRAKVPTYTFSATANIDSISSSDNGDTVDVRIDGLDTNFEEVTQTITLTGNTTATLGTPLIRAFRMVNVGSTDLAGEVFLYINGAAITAGVPDLGSDIRAIINNGNNQTLMAIYTIPAGKTGYMRDWYAVLSRNKANVLSTIHLDARPFGQVFQLKHLSSIGSSGTSYVQHKYEEPEIFLEKTDILMHADTTVNDSGVAAGFDIVLVDN